MKIYHFGAEDAPVLLLLPQPASMDPASTNTRTRLSTL